MTHADRKLRSTSPDRAVATEGSHHRLSTLPGTKWRSALGALAEAPLRLHRYRKFHTEVVEDAIRAFDCGRCT